MLRRPGPRRILFDGKRNTVSTSHVILEMATAAPQGIEIRVSERIWSFFFTWEATSVNISWNFRNFGFCIWPCSCKISSQNNFPGHRGPTNTTSEYLSTNWRAEIKIYRADLAQFTKTSSKCPKIRLAFFWLRRPGPRAVLLRRTRKTVSTSHIQLEMTTAAPQGIEIRVSEEFLSFWGTWGVTSGNISWKFRNFEFCTWPLSPKIWCPEIFLGHHGPTTTTSTYLSRIWRVDTENDCQDSEQEAKTWRKCPKILFTKFLLRGPGREQYYLPVKTIASLQVIYK